jgi:catechol 2,3-dioxygenase-like lactoylglutathione lyase family enzyme
MIDHVSLGVRDLAKAARFYEAVLGALGLTKLVTRPHTVGFGKRYPEFWLNLRPDLPPFGDNGTHVCLRAQSMADVDTFHATALAQGGASDGAPGLRPHERLSGYYAAFVRDPDGNTVEAVTFVSE